MSQPSRQPRDRRSGAGRDNWYRLSGIGFEFIAAMLMMGGLGWYLDGRWGTTPWVMVVGILLGLATGMWLIYKAARDFFHD